MQKKVKEKREIGETHRYINSRLDDILLKMHKGWAEEKDLLTEEDYKFLKALADLHTTPKC